MSQLTTNTASLQSILDAVNALPEAGSGGSVETCTVTISYAGGMTWSYTTYDGSDFGHVIDSETTSSATFDNIICNSFVVARMSTALVPTITTSENVETCTTFWEDQSNFCAFFRVTSSADATISITMPVCCFAAGTQVLTSLDGRTKPIEEIEAGEEVVSYNIETGENYLTCVKRLIIHENTTDIAEVTLDDGTVVSMNAYHPLYCEEGFKSITRYNGYVELVVGDNVKTVDGWHRIAYINRYTSEPILTYNIDVRNSDEETDDDTNDNYYANGIVAKNGMC